MSWSKGFWVLCLNWIGFLGTAEPDFHCFSSILEGPLNDRWVSIRVIDCCDCRFPGPYFALCSINARCVADDTRGGL